MRETRYRAWVKPSYRSKQIGRMADWDTIWSTWDVADLFGKVGTIPLEYIGLEDKNGIDVCEGDIVKDDNWMGFGQKIYAVYYDDQYAAFLAHTYRKGVLHCGNIDQDAFPNHAEVIGNIYENPELLK